MKTLIENHPPLRSKVIPPPTFTLPENDDPKLDPPV